MTHTFTNQEVEDLAEFSRTISQKIMAIASEKLNELGNDTISRICQKYNDPLIISDIIAQAAGNAIGLYVGSTVNTGKVHINEIRPRLVMSSIQSTFDGIELGLHAYKLNNVILMPKYRVN